MFLLYKQTYHSNLLRAILRRFALNLYTGIRKNRSLKFDLVEKVGMTFDDKVSHLQNSEQVR